MGRLPECPKCKKQSKMVKFMCPTMDHHFKCMNCLQCYSLSMTKISQPPRRIEESTFEVIEKRDSMEESHLPEEEEDSPHESQAPDVKLNDVEVELKGPEHDLQPSESLPHSDPGNKETPAEELNEEDTDDIEVVNFQDLLPHRDCVVRESTCCSTKSDLEKILQRTNELLHTLGTVLFYAGYAVPYSSQQASPLFANVINPLRQYRHSLWNKAQKAAHDHNIRHCIPQPDVIAHRIASLSVAVAVASAVHQKDKGRLLYSSFLPRNFNVIMSLENVPQDCNKKEFRHQTKYYLMDSVTHAVYFGEQFNVGTVYSLDSIFSIRMFLDTTFLAAGKTTQVGKFEIPLSELVQRGACDREVSGTFRLENSKYHADLDLTFKFVTVEESAELHVMSELQATKALLRQKLAEVRSDDSDTIRL